MRKADKTFTCFEHQKLNVEQKGGNNGSIFKNIDRQVLERYMKGYTLAFNLIHTGNLYTLKGALQFQKHIRDNLIHQECFKLATANCQLAYCLLSTLPTYFNF